MPPVSVTRGAKGSVAVRSALRVFANHSLAESAALSHAARSKLVGRGKPGPPLEKRYDCQFRAAFNAIRQLMAPLRAFATAC